MGVRKVAHKHLVTVHGRDYEVETYRESKTVWSAAGAYEAEYIATADDSESAALRRWGQQAARYLGLRGSIRNSSIPS
jgi:hypothetical protein